MIHPHVKKYIQKSNEKEKLINHLKKLAEDPHHPKPEVDIKKLQGKKHDLYRLRVADHRFEYFIDEEKILIDTAFRRGREYS
jgi:mRNA-degrading endonuclease RelE of RelBE toxin-antitoxin system